MNVPAPSTHGLSTRVDPFLHLVPLLNDAQHHERQLWSAMPAGGSDQLVLALAADNAWTRLLSEAEALVAQAVPNPNSREVRLAAVLLLAILDAAEPQQVKRLQDLARQVSDDGHGRASQLDPVAEFLQLIAQGPFVMSGAGHHDMAFEKDGADVALTI